MTIVKNTGPSAARVEWDEKSPQLKEQRRTRGIGKKEEGWRAVGQNNLLGPGEAREEGGTTGSERADRG